MPADDAIHDSSGNIFHDMGMPDASDRLARAEVARVLRAAIHQRGLTQAEAARLLGIQQPEVADLLRGRLGGFGLARLESFRSALGIGSTSRD